MWCNRLPLTCGYQQVVPLGMTFVTTTSFGSNTQASNRVHTLGNPLCSPVPAPGLAVQYKLDTCNTNLANLQDAAGSVIDVDLYNALHKIPELSQTKTVICYFSAGTCEAWRDNANQFFDDDYGKAMEEWEGEHWLNITSEIVRNVMRGRFELAARSGCHGVDPDDVDGYAQTPNQDGYSFPPDAYSSYVNYVASVAHAKGLAIGLKNALDIIPHVLDNIDFAVNEQCHEYNECQKYAEVSAAGKVVFNIEYGEHGCSEPEGEGVKLSIVVENKGQQLDALGGQC